MSSKPSLSSSLSPLSPIPSKSLSAHSVESSGKISELSLKPSSSVSLYSSNSEIVPGGIIVEDNNRNAIPTTNIGAIANPNRLGQTLLLPSSRLNPVIVSSEEDFSKFNSSVFSGVVSVILGGGGPLGPVVLGFSEVSSMARGDEQCAQ